MQIILMKLKKKSIEVQVKEVSLEEVRNNIIF